MSLREILTDKSICGPFNQDIDIKRDNKYERLKGATMGQKSMLTLVAIATEMQPERIKGALA